VPERDYYRWQVQSFTVRLALDVVESITRYLRHPRFNPAEEQGGILHGEITGPDCVEITGFEFIRSRHHRGAPYDLSLTERLNFERRVRSFAKRGGPTPIGYFRTHLRPGLFLDQSDFALMTEAFSDGPGIALAIRMSEPGRENAGIFFWEGGDIDRTQTKLMFPFDVDELRALGPIDRESSAREETARQESSLSIPPAKMPARSSRRASMRGGLIWALAAGVLAFAALAAYRRGGDGRVVANESTESRPIERAASRTTHEPAQSGESSQVLYAPPAAFDEALPAGEPPGQADELPPNVRSPFENPPAPSAPVEAAPARPAVVAHATPPPLPDPAASELDSPRVAEPAPRPAASAVSPESSAVNRASIVNAPSAINVDVSVEPKEAFVLKRFAERVPSLAGHVPLLGRLHGLRQHNNKNGVVSARPARDLTPQIPARIGRDLTDEIRVDVEASIDDEGVVRNAAATQGAATDFGPLAVARVRSVPWRPARSGDRSVPMDVVVHYRFNPAQR
jgi:hypothetical protein